MDANESAELLTRDELWSQGWWPYALPDVAATPVMLASMLRLLPKQERPGALQCVPLRVRPEVVRLLRRHSVDINEDAGASYSA